MKSEDIFMALGNIDDRLIEESKPGKIRLFKKKQFKIALAAACLCVLLIGAFNLTNLYHFYSPFSYFPDIVFDSMGYEGSDSLALQNSKDINPYSEETLPETLPVYQNLCYSGGLYQNYFSEKDLQKHLQKMAEKLGETNLEFSTVKAEFDTDDPKAAENYIYNVLAESEQYRISANGSRFSISPKTKDASDRLMEYITANYDTETMGEYKNFSVDGDLFSTEYKVYQKGTTAEDNILSFNLSSAEIRFTDDGLIDFIVINDFLNSAEKVSDYKTISVETATKKLLSSEDVSTSTPEELIIDGKVQKRHIVKTDLIYYTNNLQQVFVPSYRFYVKLINPDPDSKIENYGLFYVPAVEIDETSGFEVMKNIFQ